MTTGGIVRVDLAKPWPAEAASRRVTLIAEIPGGRVVASPYGYKVRVGSVIRRCRVPNGARVSAMTNLQRAIA